MINYSIVIPHYNSPRLLERCLGSIPQRDDVEVIIVDDHSNPAVVDMQHFPGVGRAHTTVVLSDGKHGKGPGYARNVGLDRATGRWVIFCDADDCLLPSLPDLMDRYAEDAADVIYFRCSLLDMDSGKVSDYDYIGNPMDKALAGDDDELLYATPSPWAKFVKREYIVGNGIRFQQVTGGDDMLFSIALASHTENRKYVQASFYGVVMEEGSLTRGADWHHTYNFTVASCAAYKALLPLGREHYARTWIQSWWRKLSIANGWRALRVWPLVTLTLGMRTGLSFLKKYMQGKVRTTRE